LTPILKGAIGQILVSFEVTGSVHFSTLGQATVDLAATGNSQRQSNWHCAALQRK
jgi:hypothetical protein